MTDSGIEVPAALRTARQVLSREGVPSEDAPPAVIVDALKRACERVSASLQDALGMAGYDALMARALVRAEAAHPALKDICRRNGAGVQMEVVLANVDAHGLAGVTAGIEALFAGLIDILSRLIGEEMAIRLIDPDVPRTAPGGGAPRP